ncbi:hypothetical protein JX265_011016 [Neoarthrinium moseri]|uniref:[histone H3]-trimethyl-L-lysine(9) demethylase n=1 Tax=Neoarthrinium moseri TaxID=1658444 RepID=A0A9Q0AL21_9PEZI|nr:hypothetical protein JX265_011016 [Neoarthrinium moseri]
MSAEATAEMAPELPQIEVASAQIDVATEPVRQSPKPTTGLHSPPDSNNAMKLDGSDDSELSDLEDPEPLLSDPPCARPADDGSAPAPDAEAQSVPGAAAGAEDGVKQEPQEEDEDIGEVLPDHWSGTVPVFKPDMHQFKDFKKFMNKVDSYGMKSGIIKIIPPTEWRENLPAYDDMIKQIRVREPIKQDIMGSNGTYRQVNILHQRAYNLPQWRQLCDQSEHQPPARRGERRANADKPRPPPRPRPAASSDGASSKGRGGRATRSRAKKAKDSSAQEDRPMTPVSPKPTEDVMESVENDPGADVDEEDDDVPPIGRMGRMGGSRQPKAKTQSVSARRKYSRREASARIDEEAFKDWDYNMDISDYTPERCEELERIYWKTLTYAPPLYGADLLGTLFSEETENWNLNKLPNLLDVLGSKIPGVNTAYLYLGMWKATFAWHLEDVDLYSINYLHFGAPKQWYSISQGDARRFEAAMKSIWPTDAKACDQFLRHKAFLISPNHLLSHFNIRVNKCISYPGEFVVTYPYGYHSGYNLGYNCAEAVNFALDSWLPMGKIAKKCECAQAQDSVWIDVHEIERKLRGESTDYEETEDEEEDEEDEEDDLDVSAPSHIIRIKQPSRKRKRAANDKGDKKSKKIRLRVRVKTQVEPPCCLCPNNILHADLLPTDDGRKAHRLCALYGPETWIESVDGQETVANAANISKARLDLKCLYCRSKRGACFQCSHKKCARSYHATCAAAAGVFVEDGEVPIFGEDGTEYKEQAFEFSCRFHRSKRDKKLDGDALEGCKKTREAAAALKEGEIAQLQYYRGDIFAGVVVENRHDEETFLVDIIPNGCEAYKTYSTTEQTMLTLISDRVEVEWKWLLLPNPADLRLQKASPNAIPMPTSRKAKDKINATKRTVEELPRAQDDFVEGFTWAEFHTAENPTNKTQVKIDFSKENQIWHYLGKTSTEARAQYTEDPKKPAHNSKSNFLDTIPRPPPPVVARPIPTTTYGTPYATPAKFDRPYQYKPKNPMPPAFHHYPYTQRYTAQQFAPNNLAAKPFPTSTSTFVPQPSTQPTYASQATAKAAWQPPPQTPGTSQPLSTPASRAAPHTAPRLAQASQNVAPHSAPVHSRTKSLPFSTDPRYRTSSTYGSARFKSNSSSPFSYGIMQPPGLGTTPSPQNGQVFKAQARERSSSAASAKSVTMPMTSSAVRPSSSASSQGVGGQTQVVKLPIPKPPPPSVLQKYSFFQVHHNRDSTKYRTPYAPWGGFTNGYEGNLRAHLMKTPDVLFGNKQPFDNAGDPALPAAPRYSPGTPQDSMVSPSNAPYHSPYKTPGMSAPSPSPYAAGFATSVSGGQIPTSTPAGSQILQTANGPYDPSSVLTKLHPAIRAQYAAMLQRKQSLDHGQTAGPAQSQGPPQQGSPAPPAVVHSPHAYQASPDGAPGRDHQSSRSTAGSQSPYSATPTQPQGSHSFSAHQTPVGTPAARNSPGTVQGRASAPGPSPKAPQVPTKQTFVPPPRPWEQLQRTGNPGGISPSTPQPLGTPKNQVRSSPPATPSQGAQPNNVSGPLWQTLPQKTMPNSNSLSPQPQPQPQPQNPPQPSFDPFQYINFQQ